MEIMKMIRICTLSAALYSTISVATADVNFELTPGDGYIEGLAGTPVGWGFIINNTTDPNYFHTSYVVTNVDFEYLLTCPDCVFTGLLDGRVITPGVKLTYNWTQDVLGLQMAVPLSALVDGNIKGKIKFYYDIYSDLNGAYQAGSGSAYALGDPTAEVHPTGTVATPEPSSVVLLLVMIASMVLLVRRSGAMRGILK